MCECCIVVSAYCKCSVPQCHCSVGCNESTLHVFEVHLLYLGESNKEEVDARYRKLLIVDLAASFFLSF